MPKRILILGAGVSGLSAGWKLVRSGFDVAILEKTDLIGGLAGTFHHRGFLFDYGPHNFHTKIPGILEVVRNDLGINLIEKKSVRPRIFFRQRFVRYPIRGLDVFTSINPLLSLWCGLNFLYTRLSLHVAPSRDLSFEDWVVRRFGRALYNVYFAPYTRKVWGRDPAKIDPIVAARRIPTLSLWQLMLNAFLGRRGSGNHAEDPDTIASYYPRRGIGEICDQLRAGLEAAGGRIYTCAVPREVEVEDGLVRAVVFDRDGQSFRAPCDYLLNTIPISAFIALFGPRADATVRWCAEELRYRSMVLLYLIVRRPRVFESPWVYFSDSEAPFNRIYEIGNFSEEMVVPGKTALCLEISCENGDRIWHGPEHVLYELAVGYLERHGLVRREEVEDYFCRRLENSYPIFEVGFRERLQTALDFLGSIQNVMTYGREGLFSYVNVDECMDMGFRVAHHIAEAEAQERSATLGSLPAQFQAT